MTAQAPRPRSSPSGCSLGGQPDAAGAGEERQEGRGIWKFQQEGPDMLPPFLPCGNLLRSVSLCGMGLSPSQQLRRSFSLNCGLELG